MWADHNPWHIQHICCQSGKSAGGLRERSTKLSSGVPQIVTISQALHVVLCQCPLMPWRGKGSGETRHRHDGFGDTHWTRSLSEPLTPQPSTPKSHSTTSVSVVTETKTHEHMVPTHAHALGPPHIDSQHFLHLPWHSAGSRSTCPYVTLSIALRSQPPPPEKCITRRHWPFETVSVTAMEEDAI